LIDKDKGGKRADEEYEKAKAWRVSAYGGWNV
jgi:hypothetical protein